jgi:hypothetical protein
MFDRYAGNDPEILVHVFEELLSCEMSRPKINDRAKRLMVYIGLFIVGRRPLFCTFPALHELVDVVSVPLFRFNEIVLAYFDEIGLLLPADLFFPSVQRLMTALPDLIVTPLPDQLTFQTKIQPNRSPSSTGSHFFLVFHLSQKIATIIYFCLLSVWWSHDCSSMSAQAIFIF